MELGYQGNVDWQDMSDYLVHFVGGREATPDQRFDVLRKVVQDQELKPGIGGFGFAKGWASPQHTQRSICMSEVPLTYLARLVSRHGSFGWASRRPTFAPQVDSASGTSMTRPSP